VFLVNTCTVRQHAEDRAFSEIGRLRHWKTKRPGQEDRCNRLRAERTKEVPRGSIPFWISLSELNPSEDFSQMAAQLLLDRRETARELDTPCLRRMTRLPHS